MNQGVISFCLPKKTNKNNSRQNPTPKSKPTSTPQLTPQVTPFIGHASNLAERFGLLHTVDWPDPSLESKTHRELHSMRGLSVSTHRFQFPSHSHFRLSMSWTLRDGLSDAVLSRDDRSFTGASLRRYSFLGLAQIHLIVVRSLRMNGCMSAVFIHLLFAK